MTSITTESESSAQPKVWDLPLRLTHWLIVACVATSWWTAENDELQWHTWSGYTLLTLILFRIYWGFAGSSAARFSHFLRGPRAVWDYCKRLFSRTASPVVGHNPLGGWSTIVLLLVLLAQVLLGLFSEDVDGLASGPLSYKVSYDAGRWAAETHEDFFNVLLAFTALHILAILFYLFYKRSNLIVPMFSGRNPHVDTSSVVAAPLWRAVVGLLLSAAFVWWLVS